MKPVQLFSFLPEWPRWNTLEGTLPRPNIWYILASLGVETLLAPSRHLGGVLTLSRIMGASTLSLEDVAHTHASSQSQMCVRMGVERGSRPTAIARQAPTSSLLPNGEFRKSCHGGKDGKEN